jgi:predicted site-specific integrase-resolvase
MKLSDYAKSLGISYRAAWNHYKDGKIPGAYQLASGTIIVPEAEQPKGDKKVAVYARVSSSENHSNLQSQVERVTTYCAAKGYRIEKVIKEVGSGVNDQRPKFQALLADKEISLIVVEHRDRATRFGFYYLRTLLENEGRRLEVINESEGDRDELMQDLIAIITSFVARYYGQRRAKRKTEKIIQELQHDAGDAG